MHEVCTREKPKSGIELRYRYTVLYTCDDMERLMFSSKGILVKGKGVLTRVTPSADLSHHPALFIMWFGGPRDPYFPLSVVDGMLWN